MFLTDFEFIVDQLSDSFIEWIKEKCEKHEYYFALFS